MTRKLIARAFLSSATLVLLLVVGPSGAAAFHEATVHLEVGAWFPSLDAEARSSRLGLQGDLIKDTDIGLDDPDVVITGAATFRLAQRHTIRIEAFGFSVNGSGNTTRTFTFDGKTYPFSTRVESDADVVFGGADYGFDVVHTEPFALGLTLGFRLVAANASIEAPLLGQKGEGELGTALPAIGAVAVLHPIPAPLFRTLALSGRIAAGTIGDGGTFIDVDGGVEWLPIPVLAIRVGYRYFHAEGEHDGDEANIDLSGPYASVTLSF